MTIKTSSPTPFVPLPTTASESNMSEAVGIIGFTLLLAFCIFAIAAGHSEVACAFASLVWAIVLTVWICKIKNRQTEAVTLQTNTVALLEKILAEIKKQNV